MSHDAYSTCCEGSVNVPSRLDFWRVYEQLVDAELCPSLTGAEYAALESEWFEHDCPDIAELFIVARVNAALRLRKS